MAEWYEQAPIVNNKPASGGDDSWYASAPMVTDFVKPQVVSGAATNPDETAKALSLSRKVNLPSTVVQNDYENNVVNLRQQQGSRAVNSDLMAIYASSHPAAPSVSADDWENLSRGSHTLGAISAAQRLDKPDDDRAWYRILAAGVVEGIRHTSGSTFGGLSYMLGGIDTLERWERDLSKPDPRMSFSMTKEERDSISGNVGQILGGLVFAGATGAVGGTSGAALQMGISGGRDLQQQAKSAGASDNTQASAFTSGFALNTAMGALQFDKLRSLYYSKPVQNAVVNRAISAAEMSAVFAGLGEGQKYVTSRIANWLYAENQDYKPEVNSILASLIVGGGLGGIVGGTGGKRIKSRVDSSALDKAVTDASESKTRKRSPEMYENYVDSHMKEPVDVNVPLETVTKLYQEKGMDINDPNGPLAFVPDLAEQVQRAQVGGTDVAVPLGKYLANVDPALHKSISDQISIGDGYSMAEVNSLEGVKGKDQPSEEAQPREYKSALERRREEFGLKPLLAAKEALVGMSKAIAAKYDRLIRRQQEAADAKTNEASEQLTKRELTPEWREEHLRQSEEIRKEIDQKPDVVADRLFRKGVTPDGVQLEEIPRLDSDAVARIAPDAELGNVTRKGGLDPDTAAEYLGYGSGAELIQALHDLRQQHIASGRSFDHFLNRVASLEATRRMNERYGTFEDNVRWRADEDVVNSDMIEVMSTELQALAEAQGREFPLTKDQIQAALERGRDATSVDVLSKTKRFEKAMIKAGKAVEAALLAKDYAAAFIARQQQMVAAYMWNESRKLATDIKRFEKEIKPLIREATPNKFEQGYVDQIQRILKDVGYNVRRTVDNIEFNIGGKSLTDFIAAKKADGAWFNGDPNIPNKKPENMSYAEWQGFRQFVSSMIHNARDEQQVIRLGKKEELQAVVDTVNDNLQHFIDQEPPPDLVSGFKPSKEEGGKSKARWLFSAFVRMERLFDWMDLNDPKGALNETVTRPLQAAKHWVSDKTRAVSESLKSIPGDFQWRKSLYDVVPNTTLIDPNTGRPMRINRENLIAMALNIGTEGNMRVLAGGRGWDPVVVRDFVVKNMRPEDWTVVKGIWDIYEKHLKYDVARVTKELTGAAIELPKGIDIKLPNGETIKGNYYPLIRDPVAALEKTRAGHDRFENTFFNTLPDAAAINTRTGATYPLDLTISKIPNRLQETIHTLGYRVPLREASKVLNDQSVRRQMTKAFGIEFTSLLDPYLDYIKNAGGDFAEQNILSAAARELRTNAQALMIGFNRVTAVLHGSGALSNSIETVGFGNFARAVKQVTASSLESVMSRFTRNPETTRTMATEALEQSGELRNRLHYLDDNVGYVLSKLRSTGGFVELLKEAGQGNIDLKQIPAAFSQARMKFIHAGMFLVATLDQASAIPTFIAARDAALRDGRTLQDAIYIADKAVRNAHGSAGLVDVSSAQRNPYVKPLAMFYNYYNHIFNQSADTFMVAAKDLPTDRGRSKAQFVGERVLYYFVVGALLHQILRGHSSEDDSLGKIFGKALIGQASGMFPIMRDIWYSLESGRQASVSAIGEPLNIRQGLHDIGVKAHMIEGKASKKWMQHMITVPGIVGMSTKQIARDIDSMYNLYTGNQKVDNYKDLVDLLVYGEMQKNKPHH